MGGFRCGFEVAVLLAVAVGADASTAPAPAPGSPEQVHLALGHTPATMGVQWATLNDELGAAGTYVQWAESAAAVATSPIVPGAKFKFTVDPGRTWYNHVANMTGLKPVTQYFYRVGGSAVPPAYSKIVKSDCNGRDVHPQPPCGGNRNLSVAVLEVCCDSTRGCGGFNTHGVIKDTACAARVNNSPSTDLYLKPSTNGSTSWSQIFNFKSQVTPETLKASLPQHHIVFGDMGSKCAFTICGSCTCDLVCDAATCADNNTLGLVSEVGTATHMLHVGDFGYNLRDSNGTVGDQFFRNIEQLAAYMPYMVSIGNHENSRQDRSHYTERFRLMPANDPATPTQRTLNGAAPNNWWYSWDDGLIHYVAISTEVYFGIGPNGGSRKQYEWLQADLAKANANRANVPWVVVHGHRSLYCSCDDDCDADTWILRQGTYGLEELFFEQGVDLFLNGHEHNYERNWPTYQNNTYQSNVEPKATIYIVTGAAGCAELHEPFTRPQPPQSAFRSNNFGYSRMIVHNHTHLRWQQVITDPGDKEGRPFFVGVEPYGTVIDDTWIIQSSHGPFNKANAPKAHGEPSGISIDHWEPRLREDIGRNDTLQTVELIADFRKHYGQGQWLRAELKELDLFRKEFGAAATWEDVSPDGSADGHWDETSSQGP